MAFSDESGLGGNESVSSVLLEPGTYYTQITGIQDTIQLYSLELTAEAEELKGDVNLDGVVNFLDIVPFILVLQTGTFQSEADVNSDVVVNFLDIAPFISILQQ